MRVDDNALRIFLVERKKIHCKILHVYKKKKCIHYLSSFSYAIIHRVTGCLCIGERKTRLEKTLPYIYIRNILLHSRIESLVRLSIKCVRHFVSSVTRTTLRRILFWKLDEDWKGELFRVS